MKLSVAVALGLTIIGGGVASLIYAYIEKKKRPRNVTHPVPENAEGPCPDYIYDGIVLYSDEDLQAVVELVQKLRDRSSVAHLSIAGYDVLPLAGRSSFDCMEYVLKHCKYIFIYVTPNFTDDKLRRFQAQMCLMDVIRKEEWRVIPIFTDVNSSRLPELNLLNGLEMNRLNSPHTDVQNYFITQFDRTIQEERKSV